MGTTPWLLPPEKRGEAELRREAAGGVLFAAAGLEAAAVDGIVVVAGLKGVWGSSG